MDLRPLLGPAGADAVGDLEEERVSRASEWAKQRRTAERFIREETVPRFRVPEFSIAFQVDVDGDLAVVKGAERLFYISKTQVLLFAAWLHDTFGEPEGPGA